MARVVVDEARDSEALQQMWVPSAYAKRKRGHVIKVNFFPIILSYILEYIMYISVIDDIVSSTFLFKHAGKTLAPRREILGSEKIASHLFVNQDHPYIQSRTTCRI